MAKHYGLRADKFTLTHFYTTDEWELFDNEKDRNQLRSVFADPTYTETVTKLKAELEALRRSFQDETMNAAAAEKSGGKAKRKKNP